MKVNKPKTPIVKIDGNRQKVEIFLPVPEKREQFINFIFLTLEPC